MEGIKKICAVCGVELVECRLPDGLGPVPFEPGDEWYEHPGQHDPEPVDYPDTTVGAIGRQG